MGQSSFRLGVIFLGIGIICLGRYLQKYTEGFQETTTSTTGSGSGSGSGYESGIGSITATLPDSRSTLPDFLTEKYFIPTTHTNVTIINELDLISIDFEIQKKFNIVHNTKDATDKVLVKYISDADIFIKLDSLYREVKAYITYITGIKGLQDFILNATSEMLLNLRQIIYTANDYTNILYKIYITFPSVIISSNSAITSNSSAESVTDDTVLANTVTMIRQELQQIPSVQNMIMQIKTTLLASATALKNTPTSTSISFFETYMKYMRVNEIEYVGLQNYFDKIKTTKMKNMILIAQNNIIAYLQENIATMNSVLQNVKNLPNLESSSQYMIEIRLSTYNDLLKTAQSEYTKLETIESFESYRNPYSPPSIAVEQTKEFRLHKKSVESFQSYTNPYKPPKMKPTL
jgi:hypothetical protein